MCPVGFTPLQHLLKPHLNLFGMKLAKFGLARQKLLIVVLVGICKNEEIVSLLLPDTDSFLISQNSCRMSQTLGLEEQVGETRFTSQAPQEMSCKTIIMNFCALMSAWGPVRYWPSEPVWSLASFLGFWICIHVFILWYLWKSGILSSFLHPWLLWK